MYHDQLAILSWQDVGQTGLPWQTSVQHHQSLLLSETIQYAQINQNTTVVRQCVNCISNLNFTIFESERWVHDKETAVFTYQYNDLHYGNI